MVHGRMQTSMSFRRDRCESRWLGGDDAETTICRTAAGAGVEPRRLALHYPLYLIASPTVSGAASLRSLKLAKISRKATLDERVTVSPFRCAWRAPGSPVARCR